ncbi:MAG: UvrD-helicase domain-containing protein, partial [Phaeodactylibacter sp.]|nr:UvrD-helicase domain-containing protein [Phaeodactylibacter sp.]
RVRVRLLEHGLREAADQLSSALIGTVHGLGVKLLRRFAFEAGVSPEVSIMADEDQQLLFNQSLATVLTVERVQQMEALSDRLGLNKRDRYDWRRDVKDISDVARANNFGRSVLETSKIRSFETFQEFLGAPEDRPLAAWNEQLERLLEATLQELDLDEDTTKKTLTVRTTIKQALHELRLRGSLFWHQWVKLVKLDPGAKSKDVVAVLQEFAAQHDRNPAFQQDIQAYIYGLFDIAIAALEEYAQYKKKRGWIDYTDMEVLINELLDHDRVRAVLAEELDLLMVDEFQDTSPIQLEIFLKLSHENRRLYLVGDPKQSIYGFRGADPELMQAIIEHTGGIRPEDIQGDSWRSREDIVHATNAIFCKAFDQMPREQVALHPKRQKKAGPTATNKADEPAEMDLALLHWHFEFDGPGKRLPGKPWFENCIATALQQLLSKGKQILPKGEKSYRNLRPGDIAILCRSNRACQEMAESLHQAGLKASIARAGLLDTAEARLVTACLKYLL